jgi:predicted GIY-YIG superfamily endonuclease
MLPFYVYILKCKDRSYYTGHTDDLEKRLSEHKSGLIDCYTFNKRPVQLVYFQEFTTRYEALCAEQQIKRWTRKKKEALIKEDWQLVSLLSKKVYKK